MSAPQKARLLHADAVDAVRQAGCAMQWLVDPRLGAQHLMAYRCTIEPGRSTAHAHAGCEEVVYVVAGRGRIWVDGQAQEVAPGMAVLIPQGAEHGVENGAEAPLQIVGAMAPPIDVSGIRPAVRHPSTSGTGRAIHEDGVPTMMGERSFRLLLNPEVGCRRMTQFTGIIPPGRAPLHAHPHEEAVYILAGTGRLLVEEQDAGSLRPGSVIFFPVGVRHTLENTGPNENLKVLGVFSPAGSPAAKLPTRGS